MIRTFSGNFLNLKGLSMFIWGALGFWLTVETLSWRRCFHDNLSRGSGSGSVFFEEESELGLLFCTSCLVFSHSTLESIKLQTQNQS
jgi:hypothetical protein